MKCPHCDYLNGWDGESEKSIEGEEGDFYELSNDIKMERSVGVWRAEKKTIWGCPKCFKLFMSH